MKVMFYVCCEIVRFLLRCRQGQGGGTEPNSTDSFQLFKGLVGREQSNIVSNEDFNLGKSKQWPSDLLTYDENKHHRFLHSTCTICTFMACHTSVCVCTCTRNTQHTQ